MLARAFQLFAEDPKLVPMAPILLYRTLGPTLPDGAAAAAPLYAASHRCAADYPRPVQRAPDTSAEGPALGELLFDRVLESRSGLVFTSTEYAEVRSEVKTSGGKVQRAVY